MAGKPKYHENDLGQLFCSKCRTYKDKTNFSPHRKITRGYQYHCKPCSYGLKKKYLSEPENKEKAKASQRKYDRLKAYGVTEHDFFAMLDKQFDECAICKTSIVDSCRDPDVDHCHDCNEVRGLLCGSCNKGLGSFKDSLVNLQNAILYLEWHQKNPSETFSNG